MKKFSKLDNELTAENTNTLENEATHGSNDVGKMTPKTYANFLETNIQAV